MEDVADDAPVTFFTKLTELAAVAILCDAD